MGRILQIFAFLNLHTHTHTHLPFKKYPSISIYLIIFILWINVEFFQRLFYIYEDNFVIYFIWAINMVYDISGFPRIKPTLHYSRRKSNLDMVYYLLNVILDSNVSDLGLLIFYLLFLHQYAWVMFCFFALFGVGISVTHTSYKKLRSFPSLSMLFNNL